MDRECADNGEIIPCKSVVICTGTFLGGELHIGMTITPFKGRLDEASAHSLSDSLREAGFELGRLKTGTPPRLRKSSINYEGLGEQVGDVPAKPFSFLTDRVANEVSLSRKSHLFSLPALNPQLTRRDPYRPTKCLASRRARMTARTRSYGTISTDPSTSARRSRVSSSSLPGAQLVLDTFLL